MPRAGSGPRTCGSNSDTCNVPPTATRSLTSARSSVYSHKRCTAGSPGWTIAALPLHSRLYCRLSTKGHLIVHLWQILGRVYVHLHTFPWSTRTNSKTHSSMMSLTAVKRVTPRSRSRGDIEAIPEGLNPRGAWRAFAWRVFGGALQRRCLALKGTLTVARQCSSDVSSAWV